MPVKASAVALLIAVALAGLTAASSAGDWAGSSARYDDHYPGYHLRPPYYLPGLGWHYPPKRADRRLYYGFHFHGDHPPLISRMRRTTTRHGWKVGGLPSNHVAWCLGRYRSYRPSDNTFRPHRGERRQCWSPFG